MYGARYSEVMLFCSMWANFVAKCKNKRSLWKGFCGGLCSEEKTSLCIRCNPKLGIESQLLFWERTLYLYERIIWEYWSLGIVRVSLYHIMYSSYLLVKICFAIAYGCRLKVKSRKFLEFFLVGDNVYFLVEFSSFLSYVGNRASTIYNTTNFVPPLFINGGLQMVSLKSFRIRVCSLVHWKYVFSKN